MYVSISEEQRQLEKLIDMVLEGETVVICRLGVPVVQLVPILAPKPNSKLSRRRSST
jgi:antitoxin (DNA-binding transcriptional repressor) of toxin-antitoxin stability system